MSDPFFTMSMHIPPPSDCAVHFSMDGHRISISASDIFIYTPPPLSDVQLRIEVVFMTVSIASEEIARESAPPHNSAEHPSIVSEERFTVGVRGRVEGEERERERAPPLDCELQWVMLRECRVSDAAEETLTKSAPPD